MNIFISHSTALDYWREVRTGIVPRPEPCHVRSLAKAARNAAEMRALTCRLSRRGPVDLLVSRPNDRRRIGGLACHVSKTEFWDGAFWRIGSNAYVVSPEIAYAQVARHLLLPGAAMLAFELCGSYGFCTEDRAFHYDVFQLSTVQKLRLCLEKIGAGKRSNVRRALSFVQNGSASPMEAVLVLLLCLPPRCGGYGFPLPECNHRIELDAEARRMMDARYLSIDLYWPAWRLGVEYDSRAFHSAVEKQEHDNLRRSVLAYCGVEIETATMNNVRNIDEFRGFARRLARKMGKKLHVDTAGFGKSEPSLRKELLGGPAMR